MSAFTGEHSALSHADHARRRQRPCAWSADGVSPQGGMSACCATGTSASASGPTGAGDPCADVASDRPRTEGVMSSVPSTPDRSHDRAELVLVHDDAYAGWVFSASHPTQGRRFGNGRDRIMRLAADTGFHVEQVGPRPATRDELSLVHTEDYLREVLDEHRCGEWADSRPDLSSLAARFAEGPWSLWTPYCRDAPQPSSTCRARSITPRPIAPAGSASWPTSPWPPPSPPEEHPAGTVMKPCYRTVWAGSLPLPRNRTARIPSSALKPHAPRRLRSLPAHLPSLPCPHPSRQLLTH